MEVEARNPGVAAGTRPLAGTELEDAVQHVERRAHLLRVRVRPEVHGAAPVPLPREHDPRELVRQRHGDVRERLVVPEPDVERRPVALDEVLLEMERFGLVAGDDHLDVGDAVRELPDRRAAVSALEVAAHARAQRLRLPDVERRRPARRGRRRRQACAEAPASVPSRFSRIPSLAYPHASSAPDGLGALLAPGRARPGRGRAGRDRRRRRGRRARLLRRRGRDAHGALPGSRDSERCA